MNLYILQVDVLLRNALYRHVGYVPLLSFGLTVTYIVTFDTLQTMNILFLPSIWQESFNGDMFDSLQILANSIVSCSFQYSCHFYEENFTIQLFLEGININLLRLTIIGDNTLKPRSSGKLNLVENYPDSDSVNHFTQIVIC